MLANLIRRPERAVTPGNLSWPDYQRLWERFGFNGVQYMVPSGGMEQLTALQGLRNPIILACAIIRAAAFSEIPFAYQRLARGSAGRDLYGTQALAILEKPWPGATTGDLLSRMEFDTTLYGNSYWWKSAPDTLTWIDPTRMKILTGDTTGPSGKTVGSVLLGYQTQDKGGHPEETFLPKEIVHYRPIPDPTHPFRGLSWLSALLPDLTTDADLTQFKHAFLNNAATPNLVVQFTGNIGEDAFKAFKDRMDAAHTGPSQGFKTLYLGAGADVKVVGSNFKELDLAGNQSFTETRLCAAAGVPAAMVGIAEGLKGSALNAGNYAATRRRFSDITVRPLWRMACAALEVVAPPPAGSRLWYDTRDIAFLMADLQDAAAVRTADATTIVNLSNAGYEPDSVIKAVTTGDWSALVHSGFLSVQLQPITPPASDPAPDPPDPPDPSADEGDD